MSSEIKNIALHSRHVALGAKMIEFAGYNMPVRYSSLQEEHMAVRENVGVFDVSHMGEFMIRGEESLNLIQKVSSNDASKLEVGGAQYSCMPNLSGGIVDDLLIYRLKDDEYMLVVNASNIQKDWDWIASFNDKGAEMRNISEQMSLLAIQGPKATDLLQPLTSIDLGSIKYYTSVTGTLANVDNVIISATGYTGSGGFELYVDNEDIGQLWDRLFDNSNSINAVPAGLGARDTLRLEMGFCLYGNDIDGTTSPIEAGLGWITKFNHSFVNAQGLKTQKELGIKRKLVGFEMDGRGIPRQGYPILNEEGEKIGEVTSGTQSPCLSKGIGMGYVSIPYAKSETPITIGIRKNVLPATVVKLPFYK